MICGHCHAHEATHYVVPDNLSGQPVDVHECDHCRRRLVLTTRGLLWMPLGTYCPNCKCETWVFVTHPRSGHRIPLWPTPTSVTPLHWTPEGWAPHGSFCADCCPEIGAGACEHVRAAHPEAGGVVGHEPARARYAKWYTDGYGMWLRTWLSDELRLDEPEWNALLAQWEADRAA